MEIGLVKQTLFHSSVSLQVWLIKGNCTDVMDFDFCKAFGLVGRDILIKKLERYKINMAQSKWIKSWLTHRSQNVIITGTSSLNVCFSWGPTGWVLGPALFNTFISVLEENPKSLLRTPPVDTEIRGR